jgi:hypothetical protein
LTGSIINDWHDQSSMIDMINHQWLTWSIINDWHDQSSMNDWHDQWSMIDIINHQWLTWMGDESDDPPELIMELD